MAATGYEVDINLPAPSGAVRGLLLDAATEIPTDQMVRDGTSRMPLGVKWVPWGTDMLDTDPSDCVVSYVHTADEPVLRRVPSVLEQPAFLMWDALKCSTLSSVPEWLRERIVRNLRMYASAAFSGEMATAAASAGLPISGDNIYTPTILNAAAQTIRIAMAELENHLGSSLHGAAGMIHVSPGLLSLLLADRFVSWDGSVYRTASGHAVTGDPGWTGDYTPWASTAAGAGNEWVYATAPVWYSISGINTTAVLTDDQVDTEILRNMNEPIAKRFGVVTWDPAPTGAIKVVVA
jgi:hypothetical protein